MSIPITPLSNLEIVNMMSKNKKFKGCFAKDIIPTLKKGESCIINLNNHDEPGSHWTCLQRGKEYHYYDSYGAPPPQSVIKNIKKNTSMMNTYQAQSMKPGSVACGYYAMFTLDRLSKKDDFTRICYFFDNDLDQNSDYVVNYCRTQL